MTRPFLLLCGALAATTFGGTLFALRPAPVASGESSQAIGDLPDCRAAQALGALNIRRGEPGYRPELDPDGDGLACEPGSGRSVASL